jgi:hypothetical protein
MSTIAICPPAASPLLTIADVIHVRIPAAATRAAASVLLQSRITQSTTRDFPENKLIIHAHKQQTQPSL